MLLQSRGDGIRPLLERCMFVHVERAKCEFWVVPRIDRFAPNEFRSGLCFYLQKEKP